MYPVRQAILMVSIGTKEGEQKRRSIDPCHDAVSKAYPDWQVYESFSSNLLRKRLKEEANILVRSPEEVLINLRKEGCQRVIILPLYLTKGREYTRLVRLKLSYSPLISILVGLPFFSEEEDYRLFAEELQNRYQKEGGQLILLGYAQTQELKQVYVQLRQTIKHYLPGTLVMTTEEMHTLTTLSLHGKKIIILPLMLTLNTHFLKALLTQQESEWYRTLVKRGFEIKVEKEGIGDFKSIQTICVSHMNKVLIGRCQDKKDSSRKRN